ncbi:MAG: PAS domain-containing protein [Hungatella hathewayi]
MSKRKMSLRRGAGWRQRQMEVLNHNIPGGAHQFKNDDDFTFISMSDSFLSMVGYTREEVETLFHNHFMEMILPKDRDALREATRQQLQKGREIELEYRLVCKSGQPIWIWRRDGFWMTAAGRNPSSVC